ncbi:hypothetical protein GCM10011591_39490 [Nocardia camponoti]|uniref:Sigma 54 modulation/S30EA ribosomal protein C-terminal domain-containing protein n=2 Tax=Nocardia camponoti TaxID=1616106 RepID=A0A917QQG9_9NOCA|nr:hypothetical protein GCM10011591_39490 [Nocardia camponoti]
MDAMDYDVYLFTDAPTGEDAIVYRAGPIGLRLARQHRMHPPDLSAHLPVTINPHATPSLYEKQAVHRLCHHGLPFLFFTDSDTGRGHLLYRRYDGDLTLIIPLESADHETAASK